MTPKFKIWYKIAMELWVRSKIDISIDNSVTLRTKEFRDIIELTEELSRKDEREKIFGEIEEIKEDDNDIITKKEVVDSMGRSFDDDGYMSLTYRDITEIVALAVEKEDNYILQKLKHKFGK